MRIHLLPGSLLANLIIKAFSEIAKTFRQYQIFAFSATSTQPVNDGDRFLHRGSGRREILSHGSFSVAFA